MILELLLDTCTLWKKALGRGMTRGSGNRIWEPCVLLGVLWRQMGWSDRGQNGGVKVLKVNFPLPFSYAKLTIPQTKLYYHFISWTFSSLSLLKQLSESKVQVHHKQTAEWLVLHLLNLETRDWAGFKPQALVFTSLEWLCWIRFQTKTGTPSCIPMRPWAPMTALK